MSTSKLHMGVYGSFIHNCQTGGNQDVLQWIYINKLWYIQTMEYYSALKRHVLSSPEKTWRKLTLLLLSITAWNKPIWKAIHCMISKVPMLSQKWQNYGDNKKKKKKRFVQDCGKKGMNSRKQRIFMSVKTILFDSLMFDICYYIVVKTHTRNIKWVSLCVCVCVDGGTWEHCNFQSVLLWNCSKNVY